MIKMKDAFRKISNSTRRKDTPSPNAAAAAATIKSLKFEALSSFSTDQNHASHQQKSVSRRQFNSTDYESTDDDDDDDDDPLKRRKISYDEILALRRQSEPRRKSENLIDYLNLDGRGPELSALLAENRKSDVQDVHHESRSRIIPTRKHSLNYVINKRIKNDLEQRRKQPICYSLEPNKLLEKAIEEDYGDLVHGLVESGQVNINKLNKQGFAPLHLAACEGKPEMIRILLECGAFINIKDSTGFTPLEIAVSEGSFDCAQELIKHGADQALVLDGHFDVLRRDKR